MNSKFLSALLLCATPLLAQEVHMKSVTEKIPTYQNRCPGKSIRFFLLVVFIKEQKDIFTLIPFMIS